MGMGMEKKNPYVMTIGFNRKDPNHVRVAEFLNEMGRGKAQYIVNAVMAYHDAPKVDHIPELDKAAIRKIIQEILEDEGYIWKGTTDEHRDKVISNDGKKKNQLEEKDVLNIMDSLSVFRKM